MLGLAKRGRLIVGPAVGLSAALVIWMWACRSDDAGDSEPPAPAVISGVVDGWVYATSVTPTWTIAAGTTDHAELTRNGILLTGYARGDIISDDGIYRLVVTVTKSSNGLTAVARVEFMIDGALPVEVITTNVAESGVELDVYVYGGSEFNLHPMYVMWVEDLSGVFLQNLFVCTSAGTNVYPFSAGWVARPQSVPYWTHKCCIEDPYAGDPYHDTTGMYLALPTVDGGPIPADLDAVTGATREVDFLLHTRRQAGALSQFRVLFEVNRSRDYNSYYDQASYDPGGQPSLVYGATIDLNSGQSFYTMSLLGSGHPHGSDGGLYGTGNHTTALNMVDQIVVHVRH